MSAPLPEKRIGDRERHEVDAILRAAHGDGVLTLTEYDERVGRCWAARTRSELDELTVDLPTPLAHEQAVARPEPVRPAPGPDRTPRRVVRGIAALVLIGAAAFGGTRIVGADDGATVFGSKEVRVASGQSEVEVGMLFGRVRVVVPDAVRVRPVGTVVFGSVDCAQACSGPAAGPEVVVDAGGAFGRVEVLTASENAARLVSERDEDTDRDRDDGDRDDGDRDDG